jgi:hypothetical protein
MLAVEFAVALDLAGACLRIDRDAVEADKVVRHSKPASGSGPGSALFKSVTVMARPSWRRGLSAAMRHKRVARS